MNSVSRRWMRARNIRGNFGEGDHAVAPSIGGQAIDKVYDAILQTASGKSVDDVQNQPRHSNLLPIHDEGLPFRTRERTLDVHRHVASECSQDIESASAIWLPRHKESPQPNRHSDRATGTTPEALLQSRRWLLPAHRSSTNGALQGDCRQGQTNLWSAASNETPERLRPVEPRTVCFHFTPVAETRTFPEVINSRSCAWLT